jgi:hypothetical protein
VDFPYPNISSGKLVLRSFVSAEIPRVIEFHERVLQGLTNPSVHARTGSLDTYAKLSSLLRSDNTVKRQLKMASQKQLVILGIPLILYSVTVYWYWVAFGFGATSVVSVVCIATCILLRGGSPIRFLQDRRGK